MSETTTNTTEQKPQQSSSSLGTGAMTLLLFIIFMLIFVLWFNPDKKNDAEQQKAVQKQLSDRITVLEDAMKDIQLRGAKIRTPVVALNQPGLQYIGSDFFVAGLKGEEEEGGLRVSGTLINSSYLTFQRARFQLDKGKAFSFGLELVGPGEGAAFNVLLPEAKLEDGAVSISFMGGGVSYRQSQMATVNTEE